MQSHDWELAEYMFRQYYAYTKKFCDTRCKFVALLYLAQMEYMRENNGRPLFTQPFVYKSYNCIDMIWPPKDCDNAFFYMFSAEKNTDGDKEYYPKEHGLLDSEIKALAGAIEKYGDIEGWRLGDVIKKTMPF